MDGGPEEGRCSAMFAWAVVEFELGEQAVSEPCSMQIVFACVLRELVEVVDHAVSAVEVLTEGVLAG